MNEEKEFSVVVRARHAHDLCRAVAAASAEIACNIELIDEMPVDDQLILTPGVELTRHA